MDLTYQTVNAHPKVYDLDGSGTITRANIDAIRASYIEEMDNEMSEVANYRDFTTEMDKNYNDYTLESFLRVFGTGYYPNVDHMQEHAQLLDRPSLVERAKGMTAAEVWTTETGYRARRP